MNNYQAAAALRDNGPAPEYDETINLQITTTQKAKIDRECARRSALRGGKRVPYAEVVRDWIDAGS